VIDNNYVRLIRILLE